MQTRPYDVITVTLNPAIDQTLVVTNFSAGKVNRVERTREMAGGKGVNVASALADFGIKVAVTGFLGTDNIGIFESLFQRKGMSDHFLRINGSTRVGLKIVDPAQEQTTDINFPGLVPSEAETVALAAQLEMLLVGTPGWVVLSGSLPPQMPVNTYGRLVSLVQSRGWKTLVDTSGEPLRHALAAGPTAAKPNIHELEAAIGRPLSSDAEVLAAARQLLSNGIKLAVVSMGENGALFVTEDEVVTVRPPTIPIVGTVGAGDAMVAGIIAGQRRGSPLPDCSRLATAFALELLSKGQNDASLTPEAVTPWLEHVNIRR